MKRSSPVGRAGARHAADDTAHHAVGTGRLRFTIEGAVQGVGFRPFVYRLARDLSLDGWVRNDPHGVFIEVEGDGIALRRFGAQLRHDPPPRAVIEVLREESLQPVGYAGFEIRQSEEAATPTAMMLPDIATCADCLAELNDPADRRNRYPFINCTNCGPRFSIIRRLPYDRPHTTMERFALCRRCEDEYRRPGDRRFHAQPNACPECGPSLSLLEPDGRLVAPGEEALDRVVAALRAGRIVAVKGIGGFHLMVDARNGDAITRLRDRKPRREKPFALMVGGMREARRLCLVTQAAERHLLSPEAPILLLPRRPGAPVAEEVAPGNPYLGIMLPATPLHHLLLRRLGHPIVATSGNLSDEPICIDQREALHRLGPIADLFLTHDRPIARHVDDSVAWMVGGRLRLLRRARGYAPLPVLVPRPLPSILAVGAQLKNTVALAVGRRVFISQHIGDIDAPQSLAAFEQVIDDFLDMYGAAPTAIAHDLHPDYLATRWAAGAVAGRSGGAGTSTAQRGGDGEAAAHGGYRSKDDLAGIPLVAVQHHHAHLASCLAENGVDGEACGVTWDGTGLGTDGTVWGGEFLVGSAFAYSRVAHLRPFSLPGSEAAVREPRRAALALLWEIFGESCLERDDLPSIAAFRPEERAVLATMLSRGLNVPRTSSAGRLFDAVASLCGLCQTTSFEGQAAMQLEHAADTEESGAYPLPLRERDGILVLDWGDLLQALLDDRRRGTGAPIMAARFHNALIEGIEATARAIGRRRVALTGGCFQNRRLTEGAAQRLRAAGFRALLHRQVPPNDGGISLGQACVAAARLRAGGTEHVSRRSG